MAGFTENDVEEAQEAYVESWEMRPPSRAMIEKMLKAGFRMEDTGGNVSVWFGNVGDTELQISLTDVGDGPPERLSDPVFVGLYDEDRASILTFIHPKLSAFLDSVDGMGPPMGG